MVIGQLSGHKKCHMIEDVKEGNCFFVIYSLINIYLLNSSLYTLKLTVTPFGGTNEIRATLK